MAPDPLPQAAGRSHQSTAVVTATFVLGSAAMLVLGVEPILLGGLAEAGRLSPAGVGQVAMVEILGLAIGATVGPFRMNGRMRAKVAAVALLLAVVNLAIPWASSPALVLLQRAAAGLLAGLLLGAASVILTHNDRPERMSGLLMGLSTIPQVVVAFLLPTMIMPRLGVAAGFATLAAAALLSLVATPLLVDDVAIGNDGVVPRPAWSSALLAVIAAAFLQNAGIGAAWSYLERLASERAYPPAVVGGAIAGSLALQVVGGLVAAGVARRLPSRPVLVLGSLVQLSLVVGMVTAREASLFTLLACGFGLFWLALQPFLVRQMISLEPTRTAAMLLAPLGLIGFSAGPLISSAFVDRQQVGGAFWAAAVMLAGAATAYVLSGRLRENGAAPPLPARRGNAGLR